MFFLSPIDIKVCQPRGPLTNLNDKGMGVGGPTELHILYRKKSQLQNLSNLKNHYYL